MRPLQEVLVDLIFDEAVEGVTNLLGLRIHHLISCLNPEVLLLVSLGKLLRLILLPAVCRLLGGA